MPTKVMYYLRVKSMRQLPFNLRLFIFSSFAISSLCTILQSAFFCVCCSQKHSTAFRSYPWSIFSFVAKVVPTWWRRLKYAGFRLVGIRCHPPKPPWSREAEIYLLNRLQLVAGDFRITDASASPETDSPVIHCK